MAYEKTHKLAQLHKRLENASDLEIALTLLLMNKPVSGDSLTAAVQRLKGNTNFRLAVQEELVSVDREITAQLMEIHGIRKGLPV